MKNAVESKNSKNIKIILTEEEHKFISERAEKMNLSIRSYVKQRALDNTEGTRMRCDQIMKIMPRIYNAIQQIEDVHVRHELMELGGAVCRCLK